jgi:TusA-related sulfurtransferase
LLSGGVLTVHPKSLPKGVLLEVVRHLASAPRGALLEVIHDLASTAVEVNSNATRKEQAELTQFFEEIARMARGVLRKRGAPPKSHIDRAERLNAEGKSQKEFYRELDRRTPE